MWVWALPWWEELLRCSGPQFLILKNRTSLCIVCQHSSQVLYEYHILCPPREYSVSNLWIWWGRKPRLRAQNFIVPGGFLIQWYLGSNIRVPRKNAWAKWKDSSISIYPKALWKKRKSSNKPVLNWVEGGQWDRDDQEESYSFNCNLTNSGDFQISTQSSSKTVYLYIQLSSKHLHLPIWQTPPI